jgi:small-conductance mechanosensitive channel
MMTRRAFLTVWLLIGVFFLPVVAGAASLASQHADQSEKVLHWIGRDIATFRSPLATLSPQARIDRALTQLDRIDTLHRNYSVTLVSFQTGNIKGISFHLGEYSLFNVLEGDIDPTSQDTLESTAATVSKRLTEALDAWRAMSDTPLIMRGLAWSLATLAILVCTIILLIRLRRFAAGRVSHAIGALLPMGYGWISGLSHLIDRVVQIVIAGLVLGLGYVWLVFALTQFPFTAQYGDQMSGFLSGFGRNFGRALLGSIPSILTLVLIAVITRAAVHSVHALFDAAQSGRVTLPGLHVETLSATRNIVVALVWALGFTFAYPYIPGSQSVVFQGLSVLFGFMVTLGSSGIASHLMSGFTLVYSRALRKGDLIQAGQVTGVVRDVGALSTKILNQYNEEVTIPNAVMVATPIRNLTREDAGEGVIIGTRVTIGYDAPWRQIHGLLLEAAEQTPGLRRHPAPRVLQRALDDFYVEYELMTALSVARDRFAVQSLLHANVQDAFNRAGVQIMSPHFLAQPDQPVLSPQAQWFSPPAGR